MPLLRRLFWLGLCLGVAAGVTLSYVGPALATRNSSGTYSLPAGNPVVSGTTITSATHNSTMSDVGAELTNSLDRNGRGAMLAPLQCSNGTVAAPSLTFGTDPDTGLYRVGANDAALAAGGVQALEWTSTAVTVPLAATATKGVTVTQSTSDTAGLTVTGNGTAAGGVFTGGGTSGRGLTALGGASNGVGLFATGDGSGAGVQSTGGDSNADAFVGTGGATNGRGGSFTGSGAGDGAKVLGGATGDGLNASAGGSPTEDTNTRFAINVIGGHIKMGGGTPTSTRAFTNVITPVSIVKAYAKVQSTGAGAATILEGFNVSGASISGSNIRLTFASSMAGSDHVCIVAKGNDGTVEMALPTGNSASTCDGALYNLAGVQTNLGTQSRVMQFLVVGAQ